jgi:hypothetical protein
MRVYGTMLRVNFAAAAEGAAAENGAQLLGYEVDLMPLAEIMEGCWAQQEFVDLV